MAIDAKTRGLQVLEDLFPDPAIRQARAEELGEAGVQKLGASVLRQDDYSRSMNELSGQRTALTAKEQEAQAAYDANKAWFEQQQANLEELDRLRKGGATVPGATPPAAAAPKAITEELLAKTLAETERGAVAFFTDLNQLSLQHFQQFGEILDTQKLLTHPKVQQVGLRGVYAEVYKPQLDARTTKQAAEAEEKIRADERQKVLAGQASTQHPYPIRGNEPSTLDGLEAARTTQQPPATKSVDDMVGEYARLNAARALGT